VLAFFLLGGERGRAKCGWVEVRVKGVFDTRGETVGIEEGGVG